ncbi:hypothetical protein Q1695_009374 [Nippostrongylus brasiliensis]|nr:hypothetical protein Q1695_009374 [Nippostrongylus brasiliensis]
MAPGKETANHEPKDSRAAASKSSAKSDRKGKTDEAGKDTQEVRKSKTNEQQGSRKIRTLKSKKLPKQKEEKRLASKGSKESNSQEKMKSPLISMSKGKLQKFFLDYKNRKSKEAKTRSTEEQADPPTKEADPGEAGKKAVPRASSSSRKNKPADASKRGSVRRTKKKTQGAKSDKNTNQKQEKREDSFVDFWTQPKGQPENKEGIVLSVINEPPFGLPLQLAGAPVDPAAPAAPPAPPAAAPVASPTPVKEAQNDRPRPVRAAVDPAKVDPAAVDPPATQQPAAEAKKKSGEKIEEADKQKQAGSEVPPQQAKMSTRGAIQYERSAKYIKCKAQPKAPMILSTPDGAAAQEPPPVPTPVPQAGPPTLARPTTSPPGPVISTYVGATNATTPHDVDNNVTPNVLEDLNAGKKNTVETQHV